jgi:hypothetical protein
MGLAQMRRTESVGMYVRSICCDGALERPYSELMTYVQCKEHILVLKRKGCRIKPMAMFYGWVQFQVFALILLPNY